MVTVVSSVGRGNERSRCGALTTDLVVAMALLVTAMIPLSITVLNNQKLVRSAYYRAVAMEIVDGELEVLAAGEWKSFPEEMQAYPVRGLAAKNLPEGRFDFSRRGEKLRLEWIPLKPGRVKAVVREVVISDLPSVDK